MAAIRWAGPALLVLGAILLAAALATGGAHLVLLVILPVIVGGGSGLFLGGVLCVFLGILLLPWVFEGDEPESGEAPTTADRRGTPSSGGLILVGPIPVFFGAWKHPGRRAYWWAALVGGAILVVALVVGLWVR
jgi:uncharacterized membrane protein